MSVEENLKAVGLELPEAMSPVANYVPYVISGNMLFISGQIAMTQDGLITGKLGADVNMETGIKAAETCGLNILAQAKNALDGDLGRITRCVKLGGFVASTPGFTDQPKIINGASDLMVTALGDIGRHSRAAVGVPCLPLDSAVEIDAIFEIT